MTTAQNQIKYKLRKFEETNQEKESLPNAFDKII